MSEVPGKDESGLEPAVPEQAKHGSNREAAEDPPEARNEDYLSVNESVKRDKGKRAPETICCIHHTFHPTHAIVVVDGQEYNWNSRAHRKMRFLAANDAAHANKVHKDHCLPKLFCWAPKIVTWHICWIGFIANSLWVVNGLFATWPEEAKDDHQAEMISYVTGVIGAFLFIVTGYLGYVEAINHTHVSVHVPGLEEDRTLVRPKVNYGKYYNPVVPEHYEADQSQLLLDGYPVVQDVKTRHLVVAETFERLEDTHGQEEAGKMVLGRQFDIRFGPNLVRLTVDSWKVLETKPDALSLVTPDKSLGSLPHVPMEHLGYRWWTWMPDLHHIGILNALVFFISTIIFFIPAVIWWPMAKNGATIPATVFWVLVLQIIPSIGFIYVGFAGMAEVSGSWYRMDCNSIGWWIAFYNMLGGWGFLLYAVLAIPSTVDPGCCSDLTKWGADLATFWGSCFFWIAGVLQCIEFANPHPIKIAPSVGGGGEPSDDGEDMEIEA